MGRGKRKARNLHGVRGSASSSIANLELEDPDRSKTGDPGIVGADLDEDRADGDPAMLRDGLDESRGRSSAYLVACHWDWPKYSKPFAVYKVGVATSSPPSPAKRKRLSLITRLATTAGGKAFTSLRSIHRAWIVGVGGDPADTIIFDTRTNRSIHGPILNSAKWCPILTAVGDKVYAISKTPCWFTDPDFPPWFEVLDLSRAQVVTDADGRCHLEGCSWAELPHPPCFPWMIRPRDYRMLPMVIVTSYAVVGAYILVSFNQPWGTYALDTNSYLWHKVDDNNLPFIGRAGPHGSLFLGLSKENGPINAYRIHVTTSGKDHAPHLSVTVLPVKYMEHEVDTGPCFFSLEDGRFGSLSLSLDSRGVTLHPKKLKLFPKKAHVNMTTYQIENLAPLESLSEEALLATKPEVTVCCQWEQNFKISCSSHGFCPFLFALLSI